MLRIGGRMVYSTCTFSPEEDEQCILQFLDTHPLYRLIQVPLYDGMQHGLIKDAQSAIRLWPHKLHGEGHFVAVLEKVKILPITHRQALRHAVFPPVIFCFPIMKSFFPAKRTKIPIVRFPKKETAQNPNVRSLRIILSYPLFYTICLSIRSPAA